MGKTKDGDTGSGTAGAEKERTGPEETQGLTDLARGMQHVAQCTQDILGQHFINVLNHYFDPETGSQLRSVSSFPTA